MTGKHWTEEIIEAAMTEIFHVTAFWCPSCGYQHPERFNVPAAAVPECPKCQQPLRWVKGFPEEVERFLEDVKESPDNRRRHPSSDYWG